MLGLCPPSSSSRQNKSQPQFRSEYNVYSTFQSHEPEFDYLKSLEIEEKINKIRWLPQKNAAQFLLSTNGTKLDLLSFKSELSNVAPDRQKQRLRFLCTQPRHWSTCLAKRRLVAPLSSFTPFLVFVTDKTIKLWKISERDKRPEGYNLKEEDGRYKHPNTITSLRVSVNRHLRGCGSAVLVTPLPFSHLYFSAYFQPPVEAAAFSFLLSSSVRGVQRGAEMET